MTVHIRTDLIVGVAKDGQRIPGSRVIVYPVCRGLRIRRRYRSIRHVLRTGRGLSQYLVRAAHDFLPGYRVCRSSCSSAHARDADRELVLPVKNASLAIAASA